MDTDYKKFITIEPDKRGGKPCVIGMRITVNDVLGYLASGMTTEQILEDFPELTKEDIQACISYSTDFEMLTSFYIIDDCYPDTSQVILNAIQEIRPEDFGMHIQQISFSNQIQFTTDTERSIEFNLFDIMGRQTDYFPNTNYSAGHNSILLNKIPSKGIYILTTRINNQVVTSKIIFQ